MHKSTNPSSGVWCYRLVTSLTIRQHTAVCSNPTTISNVGWGAGKISFWFQFCGLAVNFAVEGLLPGRNQLVKISKTASGELSSFTFDEYIAISLDPPQRRQHRAHPRQQRPGLVARPVSRDRPGWLPARHLPDPRPSRRARPAHGPAVLPDNPQRREKQPTEGPGTKETWANLPGGLIVESPACFHSRMCLSFAHHFYIWDFVVLDFSEKAQWSLSEVLCTETSKRDQGPSQLITDFCISQFFYTPHSYIIL